MSTNDFVARRPTVRVPKLLVGVLLAIAAALVLLHRAYQTAEIALAGTILGMATPGGVYVAADRQTVYFGLGSDTPLGLQMTPECTSAFLLVPLVVVAAILIALRPRITRRVSVALALAAVALIVVNQIRILTLAWLVSWLGTNNGYYWGHTLIGSLVSVLGGAVALVLFVWLATRQPRQRPTGPDTGDRNGPAT